MVQQLLRVVIALACVCACAHAHMGYWGGQSPLQPVAGLYVKPSHDGITGDLYVAASEDNGVNSQWVSEQPINFMQSYAQGQSAVPISYSSSLTTAKSPLEEVITAQKRAVITNPQVQYTYPVGADGKPVLSYPYTMMAGAGTTAQYPEAAAAAYAGHPYSAFHYFYPYLMSAALANAMKELGVNEETTNAVATPAATPAASAWASSAYYPWQYMMDPTAWAQHAAAAAAAAATTPAPAAPAQEAQTSNETANMQ
ncbi:uncharacterized protein LOC125489074 [Plutella xylostella]|uniref:uncharacterized protein LOC125489074 n=1 Tax=Plutella xylostella TaxID=51655 RepID=UPI002032D173|nr:uncharacterized protein LOC125489074 [Plutella xylostella]